MEIEALWVALISGALVVIGTVAGAMLEQRGARKQHDREVALAEEGRLRQEKREIYMEFATQVEGQTAAARGLLAKLEAPRPPASLPLLPAALAGLLVPAAGAALLAPSLLLARSARGRHERTRLQLSRAHLGIVASKRVIEAADDFGDTLKYISLIDASWPRQRSRGPATPQHEQLLAVLRETLGRVDEAGSAFYRAVREELHYSDESLHPPAQEQA